MEAAELAMEAAAAAAVTAAAVAVTAAVATLMVAAEEVSSGWWQWESVSGSAAAIKRWSGGVGIGEVAVLLWKLLQWRRRWKCRPAMWQKAASLF